MAVLVFLQQRSVPGAGSCRASERAGASPRASPTCSASVFPAQPPPRVPQGPGPPAVQIGPHHPGGGGLGGARECVWGKL